MIIEKKRTVMKNLGFILLIIKLGGKLLPFFLKIIKKFQQIKGVQRNQ